MENEWKWTGGRQVFVGEAIRCLDIWTAFLFVAMEMDPGIPRILCSWGGCSGHSCQEPGQDEKQNKESLHQTGQFCPADPSRSDCVCIDCMVLGANHHTIMGYGGFIGFQLFPDVY